MKVVVTGATGNVGTALVRRLGESASVDVILGVARRPPNLSAPKTDWVIANVARDDLRVHFHDADAVVHLAWLFQPTHRPQVTWDNNVFGTVRVLEAARAARVGTLVVASSVGAYSPNRGDDLVDETWPTHGCSPAAYSREKAYVERLLDAFEARNPDCRLVRMRPAFIFQKISATQQRRLFAGPLLPGSLVRPRLLPLLPFPQGLRFQALHADDAAEAYRLAVVGDIHGAFNLTADPDIRADDVAALMRARVGSVPPGLVRGALRLAWTSHLVPASPDLFDLVMQLPLMSSQRARDELGWSPRMSSRDAIQEFLTGLQTAADAPTPPLAAESGGRMRGKEFSTGVGSRP